MRNSSSSSGHDADRPREPDEHPGSHSGQEDLPHERAVPGTASLREGYARGGTADDEPLAGVEKEPENENGGDPGPTGENDDGDANA